MGKIEISKRFKLPIGWWKRVPSFQSSHALRPTNRRSGPRRRGNTWVGSISSSNPHTQVHASRTNRWIGDHVIQYFLFTRLSNHLLPHLSQWYWMKSIADGGEYGELIYTHRVLRGSFPILIWALTYVGPVTSQNRWHFFTITEHKQSCLRVAECGVL